MRARETRLVSRVRNKSLFYILPLVSGLLTSIFVIIDDYVNTEYIQDPYLFGTFEMVAGLIASLILVLFLHIPTKKLKKDGEYYNLGYFFDKNFKYLQFPKGKIGLYTLIAGIFASGNNILYFILIGRNDASVIMPFGQFVLIYLLLGDTISDKERPVMVEIQSIAMIAVGVLVSSLTGASIENPSDLWINIILIVGPYAIFAAFYIFFQKKALTTKNEERRTIDTINLRVWTLIIMTISMVLVSIPSLTSERYIQITNNWKPALIPVIVSMLIAFFSVIFYSRALTMGKMSVVRSLRSISIVTTFPILALAGIWFPSLINEGFADPMNLILKISGSILIVVGVIALALSENKTILLAKVKHGEEIVMRDLLKMKGVVNVSFITGTYDLLINIKIRSIGKTFSLIENSISKLTWIADVTTMQIMKEYE